MSEQLPQGQVPFNDHYPPLPDGIFEDDPFYVLDRLTRSVCSDELLDLTDRAALFYVVIPRRELRQEEIGQLLQHATIFAQKNGLPFGEITTRLSSLQRSVINLMHDLGETWKMFKPEETVDLSQKLRQGIERCRVACTDLLQSSKSHFCQLIPFKHPKIFEDTPTWDELFKRLEAWEKKLPCSEIGRPQGEVQKEARQDEVSGSDQVGAGRSAGNAVTCGVPLEELGESGSEELKDEPGSQEELQEETGQEEGDGDDQASAGQSDRAGASGKQRTAEKAASDDWIWATEGNGYRVVGMKERGFFSNLRGLAMIEKLVQSPNQPVLMQILDGGKPELLNLDPRSKQPAMDEQAIKDIFKIISVLKSELEQAESEERTMEAKEIRSELEELQRFFSKDFWKNDSGRKGKVPDLNNLANKLRPKIFAALNRVYEAMREANPPMSTLAAHLESAISSQGATFVYRPTIHVTWKTTL